MSCVRCDHPEGEHVDGLGGCQHVDDAGSQLAYCMCLYFVKPAPRWLLWLNGLLSRGRM